MGGPALDGVNGREWVSFGAPGTACGHACPMHYDGWGVCRDMKSRVRLGCNYDNMVHVVVEEGGDKGDVTK